jgi:DNA-binding transcriptional MerR regulator
MQRRFTLGEVCDLCGVTADELRRVEKDYPSLKLNRRRGHRPVYERDEVLLLCTVLELLRAKGVDVSKRVESPAEDVSEGLSSRQLHEELLAIRNSLLE